MVLFCSVTLPAALYAESTFVPNVPIMPLKSLKPGMVGEVHTVLSGTKITKFKVTIVGVVPRKTSPKNLILFKIEDRKSGQNILIISIIAMFFWAIVRYMK